MSVKHQILKKLFLCIFFLSLIAIVFLNNEISIHEIVLPDKLIFNNTVIDEEFYYNNFSASTSKSPSIPSIFCFILTTEDRLNKNAKTVYESWAHLCDNHTFVSVLSSYVQSGNESISIKYKNLFNVLQPQFYTRDSYANLTNKIYRTVINLYQDNPNYDWYLKADDDTFIFYENLQRFLRDKNPKSPVTYGYDFKIIVEGGYHSGGAGYLLSRESLHRLGKQLVSNYSVCPNKGIEDVEVAECLRKLKVYPEPSTDDKGRERFHSMDIRSSYELTPNMDWLFSYAKNPPKKGLECCSDSSISFHKPFEDITVFAEILKMTGSMTNFSSFIDLYYAYKDISKPIFEM